MRLLPYLVLGLVGFQLASHEVAAQIGPPPPTTWDLFQNDPNPFCSNPGATRVNFQVLQQAHVELVVLSPDGTQVVRTLVDQMLVVGLHSVAWNGHDAGDLPLPNGLFPYRMRATDGQSNLLFQGTKTVTVECLLGVQPETWKSVKQLYR